MHVTKGQKVKVLSGKDRGRTGKVLRALPSRNMVLVEGMNLVKKHQRPRKSNEKGQIIDKPMPLNASNVAPVKE